MKRLLGSALLIYFLSSCSSSTTTCGPGTLLVDNMCVIPDAGGGADLGVGTDLSAVPDISVDVGSENDAAADVGPEADTKTDTGDEAELPLDDGTSVDSGTDTGSLTELPADINVPEDVSEDVGAALDTASDTTQSETNYRKVAYFTEWGIYGRDYQVEDIPAELITHINYAFINISPDGTCVVHDDWAAYGASGGNLPNLLALNQAHPNLKVMMSIGGWTLSSMFPTVAATPESRQNFVASCVQMMTTEGFDGIDVDWEYPVSGGLYPGTPEDKANYTLLMQEFRSQLDAAGGGLLSIAAPAGSTTIENMDVAGLAAVLDWMNLMTYDFHGGWEASTHFNSPLFAGSDFPAGLEDPQNVHTAVETYLALGLPPEKLVVGMPLYGRGWGNVPATNSGLFQSGSSTPGTWEDGVFDYADIVNNILTNPACTQHWHDEAKVPWLYCTDGRFINYADTASWGHKLDYIKSHGLGGAMTWELSSDDASHTMIQTMDSKL